MTDVFRRKAVQTVGTLERESTGGSTHLKRTLGPVQLVFIGVGAIVGAGIFSLTGTAAAHYAGPGIIYSFIIAGILCAFAGLCYSEMAAMIPVAGSAYTYCAVRAGVTGNGQISKIGFLSMADSDSNNSFSDSMSFV